MTDRTTAARLTRRPGPGSGAGRAARSGGRTACRPRSGDRARPIASGPSAKPARWRDRGDSHRRPERAIAAAPWPGARRQPSGRGGRHAEHVARASSATAPSSTVQAGQEHAPAPAGHQEQPAVRPRRSVSPGCRSIGRSRRASASISSGRQAAKKGTRRSAATTSTAVAGRARRCRAAPPTARA